MLILSSHICSLLTLVFFRFIHFQWWWILTLTLRSWILDIIKNFKYYIIIKIKVNILSCNWCYFLLSRLDVTNLQLSMLIFLRIEKFVDVSHLWLSMFIFLVLVTGPNKTICYFLSWFSLDWSFIRSQI